MAHLWGAKTGNLSYQVLQEFYVTVTAKLLPSLDPKNAPATMQIGKTYEEQGFYDEAGDYCEIKKMVVLK